MKLKSIHRSDMDIRKNAFPVSEDPYAAQGRSDGALSQDTKM